MPLKERSVMDERLRPLGESVSATKSSVMAIVDGRPATIPPTSVPKRSAANEQPAVNAPPTSRLAATCRNRPSCIYFRPSSSFATAATRCGSNPNFSSSAFSGADAPNVCMPMTRPFAPT
jgi:hypothetical protein